MKKSIIIIFLLIVAISTINAQSNTLRFMGIPISGTVAQMTQKLKAKGFKQDPGSKMTSKSNGLTGKFMGKNAGIFILAQQNRVTSLFVLFMDKMTDDDAAALYLSVCKSYTDSGKYEILPLSNGDKCAFIQKSKNGTVETDPYKLGNRMIVVMYAKSQVCIIYGKMADIVNSSR